MTETAHGYFVYCWEELAQIQGLFLLLSPSYQWTRNWEGTQQGWDTPDHVASHSAMKWGEDEGRQRDIQSDGIFLPKSPLCDGALPSELWLNTCLHMGREWIPSFALLAHLPIKLLLSLPRSFLIITHLILAPIPQGAVREGLCGVQLLAGFAPWHCL